jgi:thiamine biosynthesis lipoprotein
VGFDLGGIAKGWLAEAVAGQLGVLGPCLVDLGGDIAAHGAPAGQPGWPVSIVDPWHPDSDLVVLALRGRAIATSGTDHRQWDGPDGGRRHHIIDPRTGAPAVTDALTVSVVAADAVSAEVLAKVALLQGAEAGAAYVEQAGAEALVITERGALVTTAGFTALEWAQATQAVLI